MRTEGREIYRVRWEREGPEETIDVAHRECLGVGRDRGKGATQVNQVTSPIFANMTLEIRGKIELMSLMKSNRDQSQSCK